MNIDKLQMKHFLTGGRNLAAAASLATLGLVLLVTTSFAASPSYCRAYAHDYSLRYSAGGAMGGVVRGAVGGAVIGGLAGGGRGARRGAGVGAIAGGTTRGLQKSSLYNQAYADCMRGRWP